MNKAIFLDRDGTICEDVGELTSVNDLIFIPGALYALRMLQKEYLLFIISNQPSAGKNMLSYTKHKRFFEDFNDILKREGILIQYTYWCSHEPDEGCICRKPKTYFIEKAAKEFNINLKESYVIGDHPFDTEMGNRVGARTIYVKTGHGEKHKHELTQLSKPNSIGDNLVDAAFLIVFSKELGLSYKIIHNA